MDRPNFEVVMENEELKDELEKLQNKYDSLLTTTEALAWGLGAVVIAFFLMYGCVVYNLWC